MTMDDGGVDVAPAEVMRGVKRAILLNEHLASCHEYSP